MIGPRMWNVECKGKIIAKAQVHTPSRQEAIAYVKDKLAENVFNFLDTFAPGKLPPKKVTMPEVVAWLNQCTWTATVCPEGIVKIEWDLHQ